MQIVRVKKMELNDLFFLLGTALIPFDNMIFAPSNGWATIAPFLFFLYVILNFRYVYIRARCIVVAGCIGLISLFNCITYSIVISNVVDVVGTLLLGISFYEAISIYFIRKKCPVDVFLKVLCIVYSISFICGIVWLCNISAINDFLYAIEKRHYTRLKFTFTEPSFIGMHVYGVILPTIIIFNKNYKRQVLWLKILFALFVVTAAVSGGSARFYVDTIMVCVIYVVYELICSKIRFFKKCIIALLAVVVAVVAYRVCLHIQRLNDILTYGVYYDASLASRWFRVNATLKGMFSDGGNLFTILFGYGIGNEYYPFSLGYDAAYAEYGNGFLIEIDALKNSTDALTYCGHLKIICNFGLVAYILLLIYMLRRKSNWFLFLLTLYLYLQFDSFAFYIIWIYFFAAKYLNRGMCKIRGCIVVRNAKKYPANILRVTSVEAGKNFRRYKCKYINSFNLNMLFR